MSTKTTPKSPRGPAPRDPLGLARTHLANERTLLAYIRTALALGAGAAALFHFYHLTSPVRIGVWVTALAGVLTLAVGTWRFFAVRNDIKSSDE